MAARKSAACQSMAMALAVSLVFCLSASGAQAISIASRCSSLPEPDVVNEFLLHNCSQWTNPVLGGQLQALQLIKCRSLSASGSTYEFYQAQVPSEACEKPPPLVTVVHHRKVPLSGRWFWHPWTVAIFLSLFTMSVLVPLLCFAVVSGAIILGPGLLPFFLWNELIDGLTMGERFEQKTWQGTGQQQPGESIEDVSVEGQPAGSGPVFLKILSAKTADSMKMTLKDIALFAAQSVAFIVGLRCFCMFMAMAGYAVIETPKALKCLYPETWVDTLGPVRLIDPNQGLNQYLASTLGESNLTLKLCATKRLQFYVGCSSSCKVLGEPYAERLPVAGPTVDNGCPGTMFRIAVLVSVCVASLVFLAITKFCVECCWDCCSPRLPHDMESREGSDEATGIELEGLNAKDETDEENPIRYI